MVPVHKQRMCCKKRRSPSTEVLRKKTEKDGMDTDKYLEKPLKEMRQEVRRRRNEFWKCKKLTETERESSVDNKVGKGTSTSQPRPRVGEQNEEKAPNSERKDNKQEANSHIKRPAPISAEHKRTGEQVIPLTGK